MYTEQMLADLEALETRFAEVLDEAEYEFKESFGDFKQRKEDEKVAKLP